MKSKIACALLAVPALARIDMVCQLDWETGPCRAAFPRWHFNRLTGTCDQKTFGGCKGNENNFFTQSACETRCARFGQNKPSTTVKPVKTTTTLENSEELRDLFSKPTKAPGSQVCVEEPFVMGRCRRAVQRWSWNADTATCEEFTYGGCYGTKNNFPTKAKCDESCRAIESRSSGVIEQMQNDAVAGLSMEEEEPETGTSDSTENEESNDASKNVDSESSDDEEPGEPTDPDVVCRRKSHTGRCRAAFERFYFDVKSGTCKTFVFGGCDNNGNNFESKEECMGFCGELVKGQTMEELLGSNQDTEEEAEEEEPMPFARFFGLPSIPPKLMQDTCALPKDVGPCRGMLPAFMFDGENCVGFFYGGCDGNANRFETIEACQSRCMMRNDANVGGEDESEDGVQVVRRLSKAERREKKMRERLARKQRGKTVKRKKGRNGRRGKNARRG